MSATAHPAVVPSARPHPAWLGLLALTCGLMMLALYFIFVVAPVELQMGVVQKIFYFHVPSAYAMYVAYGICGVASAAYLVRRQAGWDALAVASAEVGLVFNLFVVISGPLWARKAWGVWWAWDPQLTATLLAAMIFTSYVVLRSFGGGETERRFAAGLAIVGLFDLPIIHYAVDRWRGQHPVVVRNRGGGLDPDMRTALLIGFALFTALVILLIWTRVKAEKQRQRLLALELEAAEAGLLEDI
jgi:heme exporter protein C